MSEGTGAGGAGSASGGGNTKGTRIRAATGAPPWVAGVKRHWRTAAIAAASKAGPAPRPVQQVEAAYPLAAASSSPQRVELLVTVGVDGGVVALADVEDEAGGPAACGLA